MKIKCYHARRVELVVDSEPTLFFEGPLITPLIATIVLDAVAFDLEDIWDCCNNSCWWDHNDFRSMNDYKGKFKVEFTEDYSGYCNDDLIVEVNGLYYVALSCGWEMLNSFDDAVEYCREHAHWCRLHGQNKQHPIGRECTMGELSQLKEKYEKQGLKCRLRHD